MATAIPVLQLVHLGGGKKKRAKRHLTTTLTHCSDMFPPDIKCFLNNFWESTHYGYSTFTSRQTFQLTHQKTNILHYSCGRGDGGDLCFQEAKAKVTRSCKRKPTNASCSFSILVFFLFFFNTQRWRNLKKSRCYSDKKVNQE